MLQKNSQGESMAGLVEFPVLHKVQECSSSLTIWHWPSDPETPGFFHKLGQNDTLSQHL